MTHINAVSFTILVVLPRGNPAPGRTRARHLFPQATSW